jgi:GxxExxY protein
MPISIRGRIRRLDDREFGEVVFETMRQVFLLHQELGRFFDERIYQRELVFRVAGAQTEVPIDVTFEDFCKTYYIDLLVGGGAIFELKTVQALAPRHRSQLMHYLFLADAPRQAREPASGAGIARVCQQRPGTPRQDRIRGG